MGTRVAKIQQNSDIESWRWIDTNNNPADIPSRGVMANKLKNNEKWFRGPAFLTRDEDSWRDLQPGEAKGMETMTEVRKGVAFLQTKKAINYKDGYNREDGNSLKALFNIGSWAKLGRVVAWCRRFKTKQKGNLQQEEIRRAEESIIRLMQKMSFEATWHELVTMGKASTKSSLENLLPFLDQQGLIRASSRLQRMEHLSYENRFPIILPKDHPFTTLLIEATHRRLLHTGSQHTLAEIQQKYKIIRGMNLVRKTVRSCITCRRKRAKPTTQLMAPLPDFRFPQHRTDPFAATALDAAGPFYTRENKGDGTKKVYFALFTCLVYRAVHLEPLFSMTAASFLQALDRFCARRGVPARVISDNGTNFTAAAAEIAKLWRKENKDYFRQQRPNINWEFLPPYAPHFGGVHERMIGATKTALYHVFKPNTAVPVESYMTALVVVEGILNSRPLTYVSADDDAVNPLTPAHFLNTQPYRATAKLPGEASRQSAWRQLQDRLDHFWRRFTQEMRPHLQKMTKWRLQGRNLQEGDVVVFLENNDRGVWPLGRILHVREGVDGVVRRVTVLSAGTAYERAVERVMLLLPAEEAGAAGPEAGGEP